MTTPVGTDELHLPTDPGVIRVRWLCSGLIALFGGLLMVQSHHHGGYRWTVATFVGVLFAASELHDVEIEFRHESHSFAFTSVPMVIGLLLLPVPAVVAIRLAASAIVLGVIRRQEPIKLLVNLISHALEVTVAGLVLGAIGVPAELGPRAWLATGLAVLAADLTGALVVTSAISLFQGAWDPSLLTAVWVPLAVAVVDVSFALIAASYVRRGSLDIWLTVPVGAFIVVLTHRFSRVTTRYRGKERLDQFARELGAAVIDGDVTMRVLAQIAEVMHADRAWIWRVGEPGDAKVVWRPSDGGPERSLRQIPPSTFDVESLALLTGGSAILRVGSSPAPDLEVDGISEAIVGRVDIAGSARVVIGVGDRSGALRSFDREDVVLFDTLCSHAAVALRNAALVDQLRTESAENEFLATHDPLTGLPNRTYFHRHVDRLIEQRSPVAVLLVDLNRFKEINDTLGHTSGDDLLVEIGRRLTPLLGDGELAARLGGDEFAIAICVADEVSAVARARGILAEISRPVSMLGVDIDVDACVGVAVPSRHRVTDGGAAGLLREADVAMYTAKEAQVGVEAYSPDRDEYSPKKLAMAGRLRRALDDDELFLHYQPQIDLVTGEIVGVEALVRWHDPGRGDVPPQEFVEVAERTDLIHPLTAFVLRAAIGQAATWYASGHPLRVAVNISARNLTEEHLVPSIEEALAAEGLPAELLEVEITETAMMTNPTLASSVMAELRGLGIRSSVDDFGTGHSSLAYLTTLGVDQLKIDRSFIEAMSADPIAETIVNTIVDLGRRLSLEVVAEGVETASTQASLQRMGCSTAQGYFYCRPIPGPDVSRWVRHHDDQRGVPDLGRTLAMEIPIADGPIGP